MARMHNPNAIRAYSLRRCPLDTSFNAADLAWRINYAEAGDVLRTDDEHERCRKFARAARKRLAASCWRVREDENGRIWIGSAAR